MPARGQELAKLGNDVGPAIGIRTVVEDGIAQQDDVWHVQLPVGMIAAVSIMRITERSGALVRWTTPFGTTNPCRGVSSTTRPGVTPSAAGSRSMRKRPSTT